MGNLYFTKNQLSRNEMWCAAVNHNYVSHMCKRIFRFELQADKADIEKISIFHEIALNFTCS